MTISVKSTPRFTLKTLALSAGFLLVGNPLMAQTVVWNGHDAANNVSTNWSDAANWTGGTPGPATNIYFFDPGTNGTQGVVNNIVDGNTTILSLQYGNTNGFHTTQIKSGLTLTVSNNATANLVFVGTGTDNGAGQIVNATVTGTGGRLVVAGTSTGSQMIVQQGSGTAGSHNATLNLAGLDTFKLTAGRLLVGGAPGSSVNASNYCSGTLILAKTNLIQLNGTTTPVVDVGDAVNNGATNIVYLGQTNAIFADSMTIGYSKAISTMQFNPALAGSNPLLYLVGNTSSRVGALAVGDDSVQTTSGLVCSGNVNLIGGTVNVQADACYVGKGQTGTGTGTATGILSLGAGVFNVNTLNVGYVSINTAVANVTGTVNVTNGTLVVNSSLVLGYNPGATATASGTLNITNGTVLANNIMPGGGTSKIAMSGGLLSVSNTMGSLAAPLSSLTVRSGATLQFRVSNNLTNAVVGALSSDNSGAINIGSLPLIASYPSQPFPLISYQGGSGSGVTFSMGTLPGTFKGYITNNNSSTISVVITNGPSLVTVNWGGGVNANWDTTTLNWTNNGVAVAYAENDLVLFDDSAQAGTVNLVGASPHTPFIWTITNNALNYAFTGTNSVGGPASLIKSGNASLTLSESGDSFSGGVTVNSGTMILDEATSAISGGLSIASGATAQIGNNDAGGGLPSGAIINNGALVFSQTITDLVSAAISGGGSLTQNGSGTLKLSGANGYNGNTVVLQGTLALTGSGSISSSANVVVSSANLDVSGVVGATSLGNLNMTNAVINVGAATVNVSSLKLGGLNNTINVAALPGVVFYPTNITLIQSANGINGYNLVLGNLPAGNPSYAGSLGRNGNAVVLTLTSGPIQAIQATVSFSPTNLGRVLNPAFCGLSYEKSQLLGSLFVSSDTAMIKMFGQIAPAVLRVGGNSVNRSNWGGLSNSPSITAAEVDAFAGFVKALPTNWLVIYGINMGTNTPANCAAEAAYAANALGSSLLGFEIGNEPDLYHSNGIRPSNYTYAQFLSEWKTYAAAITNAVPGWAITNAGNGWTLTGPASAGNASGYTIPFAANEAGVISMLTHHYYRANGQSPSSTVPFLLLPDPGLPGNVRNIVAAATAANLSQGFRMDECGSYYNGGAPNVSDAYGTALWTLDFMFINALNGGQGVNFHGGGNGTGYTPIADNGTTVVQARPEFYGLKMFSLLPHGNVIPAVISLASNINFTAYGVRQTNGAISAVLVNKDTNNFVQVAINLGTNVTAAQWVELTGPTLNSTSGYTIGGATINADGSWAGGVQSVLSATNGQLTINVPPISAMLLTPVLLPGIGTNITFGVTGNQLNLSWPSNYTGWLLQSNSVSLTITDDWFTVPGSAATNSVMITIDPTQANVFYRMAHP